MLCLHESTGLCISVLLYFNHLIFNIYSNGYTYLNILCIVCKPLLCTKSLSSTLVLSFYQDKYFRTLTLVQLVFCSKGCFIIVVNVIMSRKQLLY